MTDDIELTAEQKDFEANWFRSNRQLVMETSRRLSRLDAQLDAARAAHDAKDWNRARLILKYEVDDGLLESLTKFKDDCLAHIEVDEAPRLVMLYVMLFTMSLKLKMDLAALISSSSADTKAIELAHTMFHDCATKLAQVVDDCIAATA